MAPASSLSDVGRAGDFVFCRASKNRRPFLRQGKRDAGATKFPVGAVAISKKEKRRWQSALHRCTLFAWLVITQLNRGGHHEAAQQF